MAFNGTGTFLRAITSWVADRVTNPTILAERMDMEFDGIAVGLSNCMTRDGQSTPTANIPMNNKKITGLGDATAGTDALNLQTADGRYGTVAATAAAQATANTAFANAGTAQASANAAQTSANAGVAAAAAAQTSANAKVGGVRLFSYAENALPGDGWAYAFPGWALIGVARGSGVANYIASRAIQHEIGGVWYTIGVVP